MLFKNIAILSFLGFAAIYPLSFWISWRHPIGNFFHRFHLATPNILGIFALWGIYNDPQIFSLIKNHLFIFNILGLGITWFFWNKEKINTYVVTFLSIYGIVLYVAVCMAWVGVTNTAIIAFLLSAACIAFAFFAMNLGHFYLNVSGLSLSYFINAIWILLILLIVRFIFQMIMIFTSTVIINGDIMPLHQFILMPDGWLIVVAIFFSTLMPLIGMYFAFSTLKLKNTQATTGILYALLAAILLGDLACKFYSLQHAVFL